MRRMAKWSRWLGAALVVIVLGIAGWALHRQLSGLDWQEVATLLASLSVLQLAAAVLLLGVSSLAYAAIDLLAAQQVGAQLAPFRAWCSATAAQGISLSTGKGMIVASLIRVRLFKTWGLIPPQAFGATLLSFIHGNVGLAALILIVVGVGGPWPWHWWVAAAAAAGVASWLVFGWLWMRHSWTGMVWKGIEIRPPPLRVQLAGLGAGFIEKLACVGLAWMLMPGEAGLGLLPFMAVFLVGLLVARASQVPGGLGVLEASIIGLWPDRDDEHKAVLVAGLLAFRLAYYLVPLIPGVLVLVLAPRLGRVPTCATASA